jgi:hypothetical protein
MWRANNLKFTLSEKDIKAIEKAISAPGGRTVEVSVRNGSITIYLMESKKIN